MSLGINGQDHLIDRGIGAVGPVAAVVENHDVARAGQALGDPVGVVLGEQRLILSGAGGIGARIAPAIEEVAAFAAFAPRVPGGFGGARAVIDDPELAEVMDAEGYLIEIGVKSHPV